MSISVTTAPLLDPGQGRIEITMPEGLTLIEMVKEALPGMPAAGYGSVRVSLTTHEGTTVISTAFWHCTRPHEGVQVVIRVVPGKDALRSILTIVISVAALAFAPQFAGFLGITSKLGVSLVAAGLNVAGTLLLNALIPMPTPDDTSRKNTYLISGLKNQYRRDDPIPLILGKHRIAPPFGATAYTEIVGNDQYIRAVFCFGYGRLKLEDFKLGDTPLSDFSDVDFEVREGVEGDLPLTLVNKQVLEDATNIELIRPLPRNDAGEIIYGGVAIETPVVKFTAFDTETVSIILSFQGGLFAVNDRGALYQATVQIRIRQRQSGATNWANVTTLNIAAKERSSFFRQHSWEFPSRGVWEIEITRMTSESTSTQISDRTTLSAIQSIRPEYPINFDKPLTLVAVRMRGSYQLNGALDDFNAVVTRYAPDLVDGDWATGLSRNPASAYLQALKGPSNPFPVDDAQIDYELIADWHAFCASKGLKYDAVHAASETLADMLLKICAAGRATPRHDGIMWGVVIDRPDDLVIDHINPRNSADFAWSRQYFDAPDGFRVKFIDETNGWQEAERVVPWPGHYGAVKLTEAINLPGKTDPDEIWRESRRRMYELIHRPDTFTATQDGSARVTTRGDMVVGSFDVLDRSQVAARVSAVQGRLVVLDDTVTFEPNVTYAIRFKTFADETDVIGTSVVREVIGKIGGTMSFSMSTESPVPQIGDIVHFGEKTTESLTMKVKGVEAGENLSSILQMVSAAPEIDILTDADIPPVWDGRVGGETNLEPVPPAAPNITLVATGIEGTGDADHVRLLLSVGSGSTAPVVSFQISHRLAGSPTWVEVLIPVADGGLLIEEYAFDDEIELKALAIAADSTEGPSTPVVAVVIGSEDAPAPAALNEGSIVVTGGLGSANIAVAVGTIGPPEKIQVYRVPDGVTLDRELHAVGAAFIVSPGTTALYVDGDATRTNLMSNGEFASVADWTTGANWTISDGKAIHFAGVADSIEQAEGLVSDKYYRIAFIVSGRSAGSVTPRLSGGTNSDGATITTNGLVLARILAETGNDTFELVASSDFDGAIDDAIVFLESDSSVASGIYGYHLEPQTLEGVPGPISSPFSVQIL